MKHIFFILFIFSICTTGFSQTEKGSWLIGGSGTGEAPLDNNTNKYYYFNITPQVGYFLFNNFAGGLAPNLDLFHSNTEKGHSLGLGPFLRYYIGKSKLRFFLEARPNFYTHKSTLKLFPTGELKQKYNVWSENISAGLVYFINKNIGLEAKIQYTHSKGKSYTNIPISPITIPESNNLYLTLGFQIYIPAIKKEPSNLPLKE